MVKPKYSPEEALERIKLMMDYNMSKTLTENRAKLKPIVEQNDTQSVAMGSAATGAGVGALAGLGLGSSTVGALPVTTTLGKSAYYAGMVGRALLGQGASTVAATSLGGAVIAGAASLALVPLVYWYMNKDNQDSKKVKSFVQMCSTEAAKVARLERKINDMSIRDMSDNINDAVNEKTLGFLAGTDEEKLFAQFKALQDGTAADFCALVNRYNKDYGDLYEDLDDDIDSDDEWKQIYRPLRNCVEDSLMKLAEDTKSECEANPELEKCKNVATQGYKPCSEFYQKGCLSEVIGKVQGCLNNYENSKLPQLKIDNKFGPKTETKLKELFPDLVGGFRDSEVEKVCATPTETTSSPTSTTTVTNVETK
jgi:hypothetical protein